jgi:hypothetical protein
MDHDHYDPKHATRHFWRSRYAIGLVVFGGIALFFLLSEHRAHTLGALPYLLLAASPFLHFFMHRGHGQGSADHKTTSHDRKADTGASEERAQATHRHH